MNTMTPTPCLVCIGSNHRPALNIPLALESLTRLFPGLVRSSVVVSPALGAVRPVPDYHNLLVAFTTTMSRSVLTSCLKDIEKQCGRTPTSKSTGLVPLDIDLLVYSGTVLRPADMQLPYVLQALSTMPPAALLPLPLGK